VERTLLAGCCASSTPPPLSVIPRSSSTPNRSRAAPRRWRPGARRRWSEGLMSTLQSGLSVCGCHRRSAGAGPPPSLVASAQAARCGRSGPSRQESGAGTRWFRSIYRSGGRRSWESCATRRDVALLQQQRGLHLRQALPGGRVSLRRLHKAFVEQSKALPMGDPMKEGIKLGPLATSGAARTSIARCSTR